MNIARLYYYTNASNEVQGPWTMSDLELHAEEGCLTESSFVIPEGAAESEWREVKYFPALYTRIRHRSAKHVNTLTPEKWAKREKELEQEQLAKKIAKQPRVYGGITWSNPSE
jgi:hypothetical protein